MKWNRIYTPNTTTYPHTYSLTLHLGLDHIKRIVA